MNNETPSQGKRSTRRLNHNVTASSSKLRKVSRQPKSPIKKSRSPMKNTMLASPAVPSTSVNASTPFSQSSSASTPVKPRSPTATASETPTPPGPQPALVKSPRAKTCVSSEMLEVSTRDILEHCNLPQVTTATRGGIQLMTMLKAHSTEPKTGEIISTYPSAATTVQVEVVKDVSKRHFCVAKWIGTDGIGQYEFHGPCSLADALKIFAKTIRLRSISSQTNTGSAEPSSSTPTHRVRGFYTIAADGNLLVSPVD
ncbi:unnamed protein product [Aphanomyces euteiches]|uniref:Uncharacterized protein n=1 Tax=Aphanomyces euteiches TaxID=100861 RepID=A0A6G0XIZ8_9STRA|nr:hypothetical protein Ae201684_004274 [Aphanomyces euteiches]KAH9093550.1 hypothetical protein Ae201684P_016178 [Aphanomyces euteiches]KAH9136373.1 hypothetical protein AeRB84_018445 [Aphanomyces euteiches]